MHTDTHGCHPERVPPRAGRSEGSQGGNLETLRPPTRAQGDKQKRVASRQSLVAIVVFCLLVSLSLWALQFGRPSSDVSAGSYTPTPLWQQLDEATSDDDTSVVDSVNNPAESDGTGFEVALGSIPDPQSSSGHTVRVRGRRNGGARTITLNWRLYQGTTAIIAAKSLQMTDSYQTSSYTLSSAEADAITDYSDLRVRVWGTTSGGGAGSKLRVTWAELETPDAPPATRNRAIVISHKGTQTQRETNGVLHTE